MLEGNFYIQGDTWRDFDAGLQEILNFLVKRCRSGHEESDSGSFDFKVTGEEEEYLIEPDIAPFRVKGLENEYYETRITDIAEYMKKWLGVQQVLIGPEDVALWLRRMKLPFHADSLTTGTTDIGVPIVTWQWNGHPFEVVPYNHYGPEYPVNETPLGEEMGGE